MPLWFVNDKMSEGICLYILFTFSCFFSIHVRKAIVDGIKKAQNDRSISSIILCGSGNKFLAGADIKEFSRPADSGFSLFQLLKVTYWFVHGWFRQILLVDFAETSKCYLLHIGWVTTLFWFSIILDVVRLFAIEDLLDSFILKHFRSLTWLFQLHLERSREFLNWYWPYETLPLQRMLPSTDPVPAGSPEPSSSNVRYQFLFVGFFCC